MTLGTPFSELSKTVGLTPPLKISYPTEEELETLSDEKILYYYRFLPSPKDEEQQAILTRLLSLYFHMRNRLENRDTKSMYEQAIRHENPQGEENA